MKANRLFKIGSSQVSTQTRQDEALKKDLQKMIPVFNTICFLLFSFEWSCQRF